MAGWIHNFIINLSEHYRGMTTIAILAIAIKLITPMFFRWLDKKLDASHQKKKIKLLTDRGFSEKEAEETIKRFEDEVREEIRKKSLTSKIKKLLNKKTLNGSFLFPSQITVRLPEVGHASNGQTNNRHSLWRFSW